MPDLSFIALFAQISVATVGFMAIVATLKKSFGQNLTAFQFFLFRIFVEVGLMHVSLALIAIAMVRVLPDPSSVWTILVYMQLATIVLYTPIYFLRRWPMKMPLPMSSSIVLLGYVISMFALGFTAFGNPPWTHEIAAHAYFVWVYVGFGIFFTAFVGTFYDFEQAKRGPDQKRAD